MPRLFRPFALAAVALCSFALLSACSGASGVAPNGYPVVPRDSVVLYEVRASIPESYEVIGLIEIEGRVPAGGRAVVVSAAELDQLKRRIRKPGPTPMSAQDARRYVRDAQREAGRMGANGLLLVNTDNAADDARLLQVLPFDLDDGEYAYVAIYVGQPPEASGG